MLKLSQRALIALVLTLPPQAFALSEKFSEIDERSAAIIKNANWGEATTIEVLLGDHDYSPSFINLKRGKAYVLRLKNVGRHPHNMVGGTFFQAVVVKSVNSKEGRVEAPYLKSVYVRRNHEVDLYMVPTRTGTFSYFCSIDGHQEAGMEGEITIE